MTTLTGQQRKQFEEAIRSAFPQHNALMRMVRYGLDKNLSDISIKTALTDLVFDLVEWAEAHGQTALLIRSALQENTGNPDLRAFADEHGFPATVVTSSKLPPLPPNQKGILVDLSHAQDEWDYGKGSIFRASDGRLFNALGDSFETRRWHIQSVQERSLLTMSTIKDWSGLILGLPYHVRLEDATIYEIIQWVRHGGRLVLLGFELGERHHQTNLNQLADEFGIRFNSDIVAPKDWPPPNKPYGKPIDFSIASIDNQSTHPLFENIQKLRFQNLCSLTAEPGANILLTVGTNGLTRWRRDGVNYTSKGWLTGGIQEYDVISDASWVPIIAEAPIGLTGKGRVVAIGTWELFGAEYKFPASCDNEQFVVNLLDWLIA